MKNIILSFAVFSALSSSALASQPFMASLRDSNFDETIRNSPLAVVDFNAKWCGYCKKYRGVLEDFYSDNPSADVFSVDVDAEPGLAADFNVKVYPTTYVFRYGRRIFGFSGVATESFLVEKINSHK